MLQFTAHKTLLSVLLILLCLSINNLSARVFTDLTGKKIEGTIVNVSDKNLSLLIPGKPSVYKIPLTQLCKKDRDYLMSLKSGIVRTQTKTTPIKPTEFTPLKSTQKSPKVEPAKETEPSTTPTVALRKKYRLVDNYLARWPATAAASRNTFVNVVSEDKAKQRYVYHSPNYEFISDVRLSKTIVEKFAVLFEATREYCRLLPISSMKAHVAGRQSRNKVLLFGNMVNYVKNGGHPSAAGIYRIDTNLVLVPLSSVGVVKRSGSYDYDYTKTSKTLAHEVVHQLTDPEYYTHGARGWFSEGLAEYCANTSYVSGKYSTHYIINDIKSYVTAYGKNDRGGRGLGTRLGAPHLKDFMLQSYGSFTSNANYNYGLGTLITCYFFHMEPDRRNITSYLKALKQGKTGEAALVALLNGRTYDQLEAAISKAWKRNGVDIKFH